MDPVARTLDRHPAVAGEPPVHLPRVLVVDVVGVGATDPEHRTVVRRVAEALARPAGQPVHRVAEQVEVDLPVPPVVGAAQVLQEEAAHDRVRHRLAQRLVGLVAALDAGEVHRLHGVDVADELPATRVGHGRDVDHGNRVAATGELELDGSVAPIGGAEQKAIGARRAGVDVLLVPAGDNARDARRGADGLRIIPVDSFQQALRALATLPRKT